MCTMSLETGLHRIVAWCVDIHTTCSSNRVRSNNNNAIRSRFCRALAGLAHLFRDVALPCSRRIAVSELSAGRLPWFVDYGHVAPCGPWWVCEIGDGP